MATPIKQNSPDEEEKAFELTEPASDHVEHVRQNALQVEVVDPGHAYRLPSFDGELFQTLTFMKFEGEGFPGNIGHYPGTNLQSVLRACLDRVVYLQRQIPHENNIAIMCHLRHCLRELEQRAAERHGYNVNLVTLDLASSGAMCVVCGHVLCGHSVLEGIAANSPPDNPNSLALRKSKAGQVEEEGKESVGEHIKTCPQCAGPDDGCEEGQRLEEQTLRKPDALSDHVK